MSQRKRRRGSGVPHDRREDMKGWVHVCIKLQRCLPSLRRASEFELLEERFRLVKERFGCKLRQFSVQSDHIHLVIETETTSDLSRYMQGLQIRFAKALNKLWRRTGRVFADRFYASLCHSLQKLRATIRYVLNNGQRHGAWDPLTNRPDPYSSGPWYVRWRGKAWSRYREPEHRWPVVHPNGLDCCYHHYPIADPGETPGWVVRARYANA